MKKLAFVDLTDFHRWPMGGMLRYEEAILPVLAQNYDIDLWGVKVDNIDTEPVIINGKTYPINIFAKVKRKGRIIPNYWKGLKLLSKKSEFRKYDVIYIHTGSMVVAASLWKIRKDQLLVYHQHGLQYLDDTSIKTLLQRPFMHLAQRLADFSFVVTGREELAQFVKGKKIANKMVPITSPVAQIEKLPDSNNHKKAGNVFIYTGRLANIKRVPLAVEAFLEFNRRNNGAYRFLIVGDGEERELVEQLVEKSEHKSDIVITGSVEKQEVERYLQEADYYITASAGEGFSVAVLEAFQLGLPVVCCSARGLKEQVENDVTGIIADAETPVALADAMERLVTKAELMRDNCIVEAAKHTPEAIAGQIIEEIGARYELKKNKCNHTSV